MREYTKPEAQAYANVNFTGVWAATLTPFRADGSFDEGGFASNIDHWVGALGDRHRKVFALLAADK